MALYVPMFLITGKSHNESAILPIRAEHTTMNPSLLSYEATSLLL